MPEDMPKPPEPASKIDTTVPHSARIWNYWLDGRDHYAVDREAGSQFKEDFPGIVAIAQESRRFLGRALHYLAEDAGMRQYLDIGTGLPTAENTHHIIQRVAPESRVVYVDNDRLVLLHSDALLTSSPEGMTEFVEGDLYEPESVLHTAGDFLDLDQPVVLNLSCIVGHVDTYERARSLVRRLLAGLAPGSYLCLNDGSNTDPDIYEAQLRYNESGAIPYHLRSPEQIAGFFEGLELVEPGVVPTLQWRPELTTSGPPLRDIALIGGVGRKL